MISTDSPSPRQSGPRPSEPTARDIRRWRQHLADERAEAAVYRDLAGRRTGEERDILLALAQAEGRHEAHWLGLLEDKVGKPRRGDLGTRVLGFLARRFGSVFVLALAQRAEARTPYHDDADATVAMAADERIHEEVIRGLATRGRNRLSGTFRAAVFGANDGLVSNLALILGVSASGVRGSTILIAGLAGLLAGALSMGAGEYVSVRSQRELLEASTPNLATLTLLPDLDVNANELALVYQARGIPREEAEARALAALQQRDHPADITLPKSPSEPKAPEDHQHEAGGQQSAAELEVDEHEAIGTGMRAAVSSFCFFASGALIPVLPYLFGTTGALALTIATVAVGVALLGTGAVVGLLSGGPPLKRALRQLAIGWGAAAATYVLGSLVDLVV